MRPIVYDLFMITGTALMVAGAYVLAGIGVALVSAGLGMVILTLLGTRV